MKTAEDTVTTPQGFVTPISSVCFPAAFAPGRDQAHTDGVVTFPTQTLWRYRERLGIPAKLVVVGMVSSGFSIADPNDNGTLDVVGFDAAVPHLLSNFVRT